MVPKEGITAEQIVAELEMELAYQESAMEDAKRTENWTLLHRVKPVRNCLRKILEEVAK
jgi:uncharacterized coiled-coil protein SlyX